MKTAAPARLHDPLPYALPFAVLIVCVGLKAHLPLPAGWGYPVQTLLVIAALAIFSRRVIALRPAHTLASIAMGVAVFAIWVGPDVLFPAWRTSWLFQNSIVGGGTPVAPGPLRQDVWFLLFRFGGSALVVPIAEELFWRAWLMRRLISEDFEKVQLGTWVPQAFWITAILFASEHGAYWDVGLAAGVAYNWWMIRTRSLADCILAHGVTNACLGAYVLLANQWQYWL